MICDYNALLTIEIVLAIITGSDDGKDPNHTPLLSMPLCLVIYECNVLSVIEIVYW